MWQIRLFDCARNDFDTRYLVWVVALNLDVGTSTQECNAAAGELSHTLLLKISRSFGNG
jgi:hypothetical protein